MIKEKKFFDEAFEYLQKNYNNTNWEQMGEEFPSVCAKYSSKLWGELLALCVEHLERKYNYELERLGK